MLIIVFPPFIYSNAQLHNEQMFVIFIINMGLFIMIMESWLLQIGAFLLRKCGLFTTKRGLVYYETEDGIGRMVSK